MEKTISFSIKGKTDAELKAIRAQVAAQMAMMGATVETVDIKEDAERLAISDLFDSLLTHKVKMTYGKKEELFTLKDALLGSTRTFDVMVGDQNRPRTMPIKVNGYRAGAIKSNILKLIALFNDSPIREALKASGPEIKEDAEKDNASDTAPEVESTLPNVEIVEDETPVVPDTAPVVVDEAPQVQDTAPEVPHTPELVETRAVKGFAKKGKSKK
jgi:hypothetical protein